MKQLRIVTAVCAFSLCIALVNAECRLLVDEGKAYAEIIISESSARSKRLAAAELQTYVAKISGGRLQIRAECSVDVPVQIYVGESKHAAKLPRGLLKTWRLVIHGMSRYYHPGNAVSCIMGD